MKTKILAMAVALTACSLFADTSYLYWMVDAPAGFDFLYATVKQDGEILSNKGPSGGYMGEKIVNSNFKTGTETGLTTPNVYADNIKDYVGSTFLFELFNESNERVGYSAVTASALSSYIGSAMSQISTPYKVTNVIPEPTSALLMLLGFAGLALKRKRA